MAQQINIQGNYAYELTTLHSARDGVSKRGGGRTATPRAVAARARVGAGAGAGARCLRWPKTLGKCQ